MTQQRLEMQRQMAERSKRIREADYQRRLQARDNSAKVKMHEDHSQPHFKYGGDFSNSNTRPRIDTAQTKPRGMIKRPDTTSAKVNTDYRPDIIDDTYKEKQTKLRQPSSQKTPNTITGAYVDYPAENNKTSSDTPVSDTHKSKEKGQGSNGSNTVQSGQEQPAQNDPQNKKSKKSNDWEYFTFEFHYGESKRSTKNKQRFDPSQWVLARPVNSPFDAQIKYLKNGMWKVYIRNNTQTTLSGGDFKVEMMGANTKQRKQVYVGELKGNGNISSNTGGDQMGEHLPANITVYLKVKSLN